MDFYLHGFQLNDLALFINRAILGIFFVLARFRWFFDPSRPDEPWMNAGRHAHLATRLCTCGYSRNSYLSGFVAIVEVSAGMALIVGLLTMPATLGLLVVLIFGTICTARGKVQEQNPVDPIDCVSCYLWRVEGVYLAMAVLILLQGPGRLSLDHIISRWL